MATRFEARDSDGQTVILHVHEDQISADTRAGQQTVPGMRSIRTETGEAVNRVSKGRYQLMTGQELVSDDPDAP